MAVRFISNCWDVKEVIPANKEDLVISKVSELIDYSWLRDTTVLSELEEFMREERIEKVVLKARNDFGWNTYVLPDEED